MGGVADGLAAGYGERELQPPAGRHTQLVGDTGLSAVDDGPSDERAHRGAGPVGPDERLDAEAPNRFSDSCGTAAWQPSIGDGGLLGPSKVQWPSRSGSRPESRWWRSASISRWVRARLRTRTSSRRLTAPQHGPRRARIAFCDSAAEQLEATMTIGAGTHAPDRVLVEAQRHVAR
ncbi:hypothetical protein [Streptomyces cremeus]|uniref:Uncharacterized protein n=1 Tax=Streptomyces cremeus TaxID=66881 RepID=A0ABV5PKF0_STRCM